MAKNRSQNRTQNRLMFPYLILVIILVCAGLILFDLYTRVDEATVFPWEGPTPTITLYWRSTKTPTPLSSSSGALPASAVLTHLETPMPGADAIPELGGD